MNFRYRLWQFMSSRYGTDATFFVLMASASVLAIINIIVRSFVLQLIVYAIGFLAIFRAFSSNHEMRRKENRVVKKALNSLQTKLRQRKQRRGDTQHVYKKCPHCHAVLRLPRRKGKHTTCCPRCNLSFTVRIFRNPQNF